MKHSLNGKTALVTGASQGIGRAIAIALGALGAKVWVNYLDQAEDAQTVVDAIVAAGGKAQCVQADVGSSASVAQMFAQLLAEDQLDILVNNAGILLEKPFLETDEADWSRMLEVDLNSVYRCTQHALAHMQTRQQGCVINIASELGQIGREQFVAYCTAKAGVIGMTKALAREFAPHIRINAVAPGPVDTAMVSVEMMSEEMIAREVAIPAQRLGQPEEIAAAVCFLASAAGSFCYGQTLGVNGGAWMGS